MSALHLNLFNPAEQRATENTRKRVLFVFLAGLVLLVVGVWAVLVGVQLSACKGKIVDARTAIARLAKDSAESERLRSKFGDLQSEAEQYDFYCHGRQDRGELLKRLAFAVPETVSLTALTIPPPPKQVLRRPPGSKLPPPQGPTQTVERVELRLTGQAVREDDVFKLMRALEGNAFTGLVSIVKQPGVGERESPRVLSFKQDAPVSGHRGVVFDIVYDIKPREFVR